MRTLGRDHITHVALVQQRSGGVCIPAQPSTSSQAPTQLQILGEIFACPP